MAHRHGESTKSRADGGLIITEPIVLDNFKHVHETVLINVEHNSYHSIATAYFVGAGGPDAHRKSSVPSLSICFPVIEFIWARNLRCRSF